MDKETAIKIQNISKQYRLGLVGTGTLSHDLKRWFTINILGKEDPFLKIGEKNEQSKKGKTDYVWALKDINLTIEKGEIVGIIGKNGAGKSTLLKILSRVTKPTTGDIKYKGSLSSLLEVGTGFHPEMTGRENIYLNGAIMGMSRPEITRKLDEIVKFANIEKYVDTPVKRYSSGMTVRLGFSIAAHLEPDILIVDEVLAVGDAEFQKKAIGKMKAVSKKGGRTVLFVSHNMGAIQNLCTSCVLLEDGEIIKNGKTSEVVSFYLTQFVKENKTVSFNFNDAPTNVNAKFISAKIEKSQNSDDNTFYTNSELKLEFCFYNLIDGDSQIGITFHLTDEYGNLVFVSSSCGENITHQKGEIIHNCIIPKDLLNEGTFSIHRLLLVKDRAIILIEQQDVISFEIINEITHEYGWHGGKEGIVKPKLKWNAK